MWGRVKVPVEGGRLKKKGRGGRCDRIDFMHTCGWDWRRDPRGNLTHPFPEMVEWDCAGMNVLRMKL